MKYDIYKTKHQYAFSKKHVYLALKEQLNRNPSIEDYYKLESNLAISLNDTLASNVNAEEYFWLNNNKKIVFVSNEIAEMLYRSTFEVEKEQASITPPKDFETFALCFSKNFKLELKNKTIPIFSSLITVMTKKEMKEKVHTAYENLTNTTIISNDVFKQDDLIITISYKINETTYRSCVPITELAERLKKGVVDTEYVSDLYDQSLSPEEKEITNAILKIAVSLLIYNNATDNKYLEKGFPLSSTFERPKSKFEQYNNTYWNAYYIEDYQPKRRITKGFIRVAHFRNLKADRFYHGKYADLKKGSRWTLVKETFIGDNETFTQKHEEID